MIIVNTDKIVLERGAQGLTIDELSKRSGVGRGTLSKIEGGKVTPRLSTVGRIAKALNRNVTEFISTIEQLNQRPSGTDG